jgi:acetyltransferase
VIFGDPVEDASSVVTPNANELVIFYGGADVERYESERMHIKGIPVFPTPERGIKALAQVLDRKTLNAPQKPTLTVPATGRQLPLHQAFAKISEQGIPCTDFALAKSQADAVKIAQEQGFPVALKISSPDILHKSDVGGVHLNLSSAEAVEDAYDDLLAAINNNCPESQIDGVLVSNMAPPGMEVIVGMNRDPQFGPIILFGLGGIMVEIFQDVSIRLLPLTKDEALSMIREIKGYGLITGHRGQPAMDEQAMADCLMAVVRIAERYPEIIEIDLNPVFAYPDGIRVADARIIVKKGG